MKTKMNQGGFTLIELLIVIAIIGLLTALVAPKFTGKIGDAKIKTTKSQIELLASALESYHMDVDKYPSTQEGLSALLSAPKEYEKKWDGPYLKKLRIPTDAWDNAFIYKGKDDPEVKEKKLDYIIASYGQDGKPGGEEDDRDLFSYE